MVTVPSLFFSALSDSEEEDSIPLSRPPVACVVLWAVVSGRGRSFLPPSLMFMVMTPVFRSSENFVTCRLSK